MKTSRRSPIVAVGLLLAAIALAPVSVAGQARPESSPGGQPLTVFDRQGKVATTIGEPGLYTPTRLLARRHTRRGRESGSANTDHRHLGVESGGGSEYADHVRPRGGHRTGVVSGRDATGLHLSACRNLDACIGRLRAERDAKSCCISTRGFGGISNLGWSADGRYLSFSDLINISGAVYVLPLDGSGNAREVLRPPLFSGRISPDGQVIAYSSNLSGRPELYIRPFDASSRAEVAPAGEPWQVSRDGALGAAVWRRDGHELYYLAPGVGVMAADVTDDSDASRRRVEAVVQGAEHERSTATGERQPRWPAIHLRGPAAPAARQLTCSTAQESRSE